MTPKPAVAGDDDEPMYDVKFSDVQLDPAVAAQLEVVDPPAPEPEEEPQPEETRRGGPSGRARRQARAAMLEESSGNTPVSGEKPPGPAELSEADKVAVLWDWFQNVGSRLSENFTQAPPESDTEQMRCTECGLIFDAPSYAIRLRDGVPARCPNPAHGTKLYPADFLT